MGRGLEYKRKQRDRVIRNRRKFIKESGLKIVIKDGELVKRKPCDCGKTDCMVCHMHKKNKACGNKWKNRDGMIEEIIDKEVIEDIDSDC